VACSETPNGWAGAEGQFWWQQAAERGRQQQQAALAAAAAGGATSLLPLCFRYISVRMRTLTASEMRVCSSCSRRLIAFSDSSSGCWAPAARQRHRSPCNCLALLLGPLPVCRRKPTHVWRLLGQAEAACALSTIS